MDIRQIVYEKEIEELRKAVQEPLWYKEFGRYRKARMLGAAAVKEARPAQDPFIDRVKERMYATMEQLLAEEVVYLATEGYEWDSEQQDIEKIIIHHTSRRPGMTESRLSAMHLIRLYVPFYANPPEKDMPHTEGKPIYSGHFRGEQQVFWAYHWLVRDTGEAERLLMDDEVGWQAGNWDVNCRSIAICIDDDLTEKAPSGEVLAGISSLIEQNYPHIDISPETLLGHREVNPKTDCPGSEYLGGWKATLLDRLNA